MQAKTARRNFKSKKAFMFSLMCSVFGMVVTFVILGFLNAKVNLSKSTEHSKVSNIQIAKVQPVKNIVQKQKPQPKKSQKEVKQATPMPMMSSSISGADFGLDSMSWLSSEDISDKLLGQTKNLVMTADTVDVPPQVQSMPALEYPDSARNKGIQGFVKINILIGKNGEIKKTQVIEADPPGVFEQVALAAVHQWRFQPAKYQGESVQVWSQQTIRFDLN